MIADFHKRANRKFFNRDLLAKTIGVIFLVVIVVLIIADIKIYQKKKELDTEINNLQKQIVDIKKSSQTLKDEIINSNNPDYLEKIGYEQLDMTKPGETEYMFVKSPQKMGASSSSKPTNWFFGAWQWLKSKF